MEETMKTAAIGSKILRGPQKAFRKTTKTPLNIVAMLSAVGSQEASSKLRPRPPRRSARPMLSNRLFSVARPAPRKTARIPTYGFVVARVDGRSGTLAGSFIVLLGNGKS